MKHVLPENQVAENTHQHCWTSTCLICLQTQVGVTEPQAPDKAAKKPSRLLHQMWCPVHVAADLGLGRMPRWSSHKVSLQEDCLSATCRKETLQASETALPIDIASKSKEVERFEGIVFKLFSKLSGHVCLGQVTAPKGGILHPSDCLDLRGLSAAGSRSQPLNQVLNPAPAYSCPLQPFVRLYI